MQKSEVRRMFKWILTALCTLGSLCVCLPRYVESRKTALDWKFAGTACALPLAVYGAMHQGGRAWFCVAAIALSSTADVMLEKQFMIGMALFAAAHVCFLVWMTGLQRLTALQPIVWLVLLCIVAVLLYSWRRRIGSMMLPYAAYAALVTLMGAFAVGMAADRSLAGVIAAVGGLMFVASDALVCKGLVMHVDKTHHWITMGLYYGAQLCLAAGCALR